MNVITGSASKRSRMQTNEPDQIFVKDDVPIRFHCKRLTEGQMEELTLLIEDHGGIIWDNEFEADTVISPVEYVDYHRSKYCFSKTVYAEEIGFVRKCIRSGYYRNTPPKISAMPGRTGVPGRS